MTPERLKAIRDACWNSVSPPILAVRELITEVSRHEAEIERMEDKIIRLRNTAAIQDAVREEREECAKVAEAGYVCTDPDSPCRSCAERRRIAAAIRARGKGSA
jgi:uncharacterized protein YydD (DUF2326 family)